MLGIICAAALLALIAVVNGQPLLIDVSNESLSDVIDEELHKNTK